MALRELLRGKLTRKELKYVPSSFDVIGNKDKAVAIIEIPDELKKKKKILAEGVMQQHKNVKTVLDKGTPRKGEFRIRNMKIISGNKNTDGPQEGLFFPARGHRKAKNISTCKA